MPPSSNFTVAQGPVSLSLCKISYCTTPSPKASLLWTHLPNRDNMFAVFDTIRAKSPVNGTVADNKLLKLVNGGELLEQIELNSLRLQALRDEERFQSQFVSDENLCVIVIVKKPLLALRYQLPDGQIRKIQLNFSPQSGCDIALDHLKSVGLPIRDKNQPQVPLQRPQSSKHAVQRSSQERPPQSNDINGYATQSSQAAIPPSSQPVSQDRPGSWNASRLPHPLQESFGNSSQPSSQGLPPAFSTGHQGILQSSQVDPPTYSQLTSQQRPISFNTDNNTNNFAANFGNIPPSGILPQTQLRPVASIYGFNQDDFSRSILSLPSRTGNQSGFTNVVGSSDSCDRLRRPSSASQIASTGAIPQRLLPSSVTDGGLGQIGNLEARPMSAPETQHERYVTDSVPLSQMLPPPRILPFPEKKVQPFRKEESDKEDTLEEVSAIKKPVAKTGKQTKGRGKLAKGKAADQNIPAVPSSSDPLALSSSTSKPRATKSLVVKMSLGKDPSSSAPPKVSTIKAATRSTAVTTGSVDPPDDISPPASHKRPMADVPESEANKRQAPPFDKPSAGAPQVHPQQINPLLSNFAPDELLDSIENWVQKYNRLSAPAPPRTAKDQLAGYAAQSEDERMHAIDNLICECLEDENFYQLVEDVEGAWKRIGLGF